MRIETSLGADVLLLEHFECVEAVSSPYEISLSLLSAEATINLPKLLRTPVTISLDLPDGSKRFFHGLVRRFVQAGRSEDFVSYRAEVVPSLWFLSLGTDCRIFQNKSVPDILKAVLTDLGVTVKSALTASYATREYCVQYRESHLAFISRLMEEEGIFYFFEHEKDKHTLVLADASSAIKPGAVPKLRMRSIVGSALTEDMISELTVDSEVRSAGTVTLMDYNETTAKKVEAAAKSDAAATATQFKQYDYPGKFSAKGDGDRLARVRIEAAESLTYVINGNTSSRGVGSGQKLDVTDHYRDDINASYHVLSARHVANEGSYRSAAGAAVPFSFETAFQAMPHAVPFRPASNTPRPIVHGSQTAVVVGKSGEEIYVDKYGRVKVQFFWDHAGKNDENSSCWVRVSSTWAGKQWGFIQLPRVGQEVIVDFLEGDPDRPLVIGRVYNGDQMPPYDLPANMTQSGVKTRSSKGGAAADANEIRFEDKKGEEQLLVHAQKDYLTEVENDRIATIEHDDTESVKGKQTLTVKGDQSLTVEDGKQSITVKTGDQVVTINQGNQQVAIKQGNHSMKLDMGDAKTELSAGNFDIKLGAGNITIKTGAGAVKQEAIQGIELKVGPSSIKIDPSGVTIKGLMVKIEGTAMTDIKGLMTNVKADAVMTVKGAITMIN